MAKLYKDVIATDKSPKQLEFAANVPNVQYICTNPKMSICELEKKVGKKSSVDLVTIAQALHWFDDRLHFYKQVIKKPNGIATWCYKLPNINNSVDSVFNKYYNVQPDWEPTRKSVDDKYKTIDFPFEPICDNNNNVVHLVFQTYLE